MSNILIIRIDHLGDLVLTTPLIRALALAGHNVSVIARRSNLPVLEESPYLQRAIALEEILPSFPRQAWKLGSAVRAFQPDLVMVPHAKPISLLIGLRSRYFGKIISMWGGLASRLLFCRSIRSGLQNHPRHISDIWMDLARVIDVDPVGLQPEIFLTGEEKQEGKARLEEQFGSRRIVIVHPGCSGNTCNLPIEQYGELIDYLLASTTAGIVLSGIATERERFHPILERFDGHPRVWNSMGEQTLRGFCSVIANSCVVVSVGTGPLHLASALGISTVTPFCRRVGVCTRVWGNLGAKSLALEPPESICVGRGIGEHCDFKKSIGAIQLLEALRPFTE